MAARQSRWRRAAAIIIDRVKKDNPTATQTELKRLVSQAYPWGERRGHPYKMWLKEVKAAGLSRSTLKPKPTPMDIKFHWVKKL